jgi:chemosensory pili system protein ChpA (sensor histidine kinase/response regulator)
MVRHDDRESGLGFFLMEAWDTARGLEDGLARLADPAVPVEAVAPPLVVLAHRLRGSAGLHGFPGLSRMAATAESLLDDPPTASVDRARIASFLGELVGLCREQFDHISATGTEQAERIALFQARSPIPRTTIPLTGSAARAAPDRGGDEDRVPVMASEGHSVSGRAEQLVQDVDRFFAENADVLPYFAPEATEHLESMSASLLALERDGRNEEHLAAIFRTVHTLKGAAYTVGCAPIGDVAHEIEDLLVAVRAGRLPLTPAMIDATAAGMDAIKLVLQSAAGAPAHLGTVLEHARVAVGNLTRAVDQPVPTAVGSPTFAPTSPTAGREDRLLAERVDSVVSQIRRPRERVPGAPGPSIRVNLDRLDSLMSLVGELMIARSRLEQHLTQLDQVGGFLSFSRSRMTRTVRDFEREHHDPRLSPGGTPDGDDTRPAGDAGGLASLAELFAELEFDRYDTFNILARSLGEVSADIGEVQAQHAARLGTVREDVAHIRRLTEALRKDVALSRMVPVGRLFPRFARQVRASAQAAGKKVTFEGRGETVNVDSATIEQMSDSLLHLVQNAISHGIEPEAERLSLGKPPDGRILIRAAQQGGFIVVEVEDDGRGMDAEQLTRHAVGLGLLDAGAASALSAPDALDLIFLPGFSTASSVTRAAGRGVGMDVVRTNVTRLSGEIEVSTEVGVGTRFTLRLPLTVAIADALMVRAGAETFAIPLASVAVMRLVGPGTIQSAGDREIVAIDDRSLDLIRLGRVLGIAEPDLEAPALLPVVVLRSGGTSFAMAVDELLGKEEIVIKRLGEFLERVGPFAGATVSGDGRVILLLDPSRLLRLARASALRGGPERNPAEVPAAGPARRRILLVDDSISVRKFVGQMLEKAGFHVFTAVDGQDALERLTEVPVDAIITDLEMPRVNGYALIEDLRRRPGTSGVPIIVLTSRTGVKHQELARRLGIRHYVGKPVDEQAFVELIDSIVSPARQELAPGEAGRP